MRRKKPIGDYVHSAFFGIEESLISNTGIIAGAALGSRDKKIVLLTALVVIAVSAVSMAVSEFISEETVEEEDNKIGKKYAANPKISALIISATYTLAGLMLVFPFLILEIPINLYLSVSIAVIVLVILGTVKARLSKKSLLRNILEVLIVSGLALGIGVIVGITLKL
ncbi:MAG: VIT1/CCC1 transporter family protein [bacterium]|nr:VIT1/CCC1 transporter family protein [bacterium]